MVPSFSKCESCGRESLLDGGLCAACRYTLAEKVEAEIKAEQQVEKIRALIQFQSDTNYWDG